MLLHFLLDVIERYARHVGFVTWQAFRLGRRLDRGWWRGSDSVGLDDGYSRRGWLLWAKH